MIFATIAIFLFSKICPFVTKSDKVKGHQMNLKLYGNRVTGNTMIGNTTIPYTAPYHATTKEHIKQFQRYIATPNHTIHGNATHQMNSKLYGKVTPWKHYHTIYATTKHMYHTWQQQHHTSNEFKAVH